MSILGYYDVPKEQNPMSRIISFSAADTLSAPVLDYLKNNHGIDPADVRGFSLDCRANDVQSITVELLTKPAKSAEDVLTEKIRETARNARQLKPVGERTVMIPLLGSTRDELPVREPGKAFESQTARCVYVVGFEDAVDGSMGRHPVKCGETIAYHEDTEGNGWWYHLDDIKGHKASPNENA